MSYDMDPQDGTGDSYYGYSHAATPPLREWMLHAGLITIETEPSFAERIKDALDRHDAGAVGELLFETVSTQMDPFTARRVKEVREQITKLADELTRLYLIPREPSGSTDGTPPVVVFTKTWGTPGRQYTYAALKANGFWYVTSKGASQKRFESWAKLWEFINRQEPTTPKVSAAAGWMAL